MVGDQPVLKYVPEDFVVRESMVVELAPPDQADQHYLLMRKCGFTTMEAVRLVADRLGLPSTAVTYGGLKDEDGHTEQLVAVPLGTLTTEAAVNGWSVAREPHRWLELRHYGYGTRPLEIGKLEGNAFRIVVRNLDQETATRLGALGKVTALVLNYYDTQRFGVPGGPKRTHHVGAAILERRWADALRELAGLAAPESADAAAWTGEPAAFFRRLDPRTTSFYLAAYASDRWNDELSALVRTTCPDEHVPVVVDGITYRYVTSPQAAARVLAQATALPYDRYTFVDGAPVARRSHRTTVVQTIISVATPEEDQRIAGRHSLGLRFFLPSGSYATSAVRQVLAYA